MGLTSETVETRDALASPCAGKAREPVVNDRRAARDNLVTTCNGRPGRLVLGSQFNITLH